MTVKKLEKGHWGPYLDHFSKSLPVQLAEVTVESLKLGSQIEAEWVRIFSLNYDHKDDIIVISLDAIEHIIHQPVTIFVDETGDQVTSVEIIDAANTHHLVQLRRPVTQASAAAIADVIEEAGRESFPASDPPAWAGA